MPEVADEEPFILVFVHSRWPASVPLRADLVEKLGPYLTRYAQTLKATVHAVGASSNGNALHLIIEWPPHLSLGELIVALQKPSARYASTTLGALGLTWGESDIETISPWDLEAWRERVALGTVPERGASEPVGVIANSEDLPPWLVEALERTGKP